MRLCALTVGQKLFIKKRGVLQLLNKVQKNLAFS